MMFFLISSLASSCAFLQNKARAFIFLLIICICFPTGHAYSKVISLNGIYFYDFFTVAYVVVAIYRALDFRGVFIINNALSGYALLLNIILLIGSLFFAEAGKFFIKDVRPILNAIFFMAATDLFYKSKVTFNDKNKSLLIILCAISVLVKYLFIYYEIYGFQDEYYEANSYRYIDGAAYFCAIYLLFAYFSRDDVAISSFRFYAVMAAIFVVLLANSRFIIFGMLLCIVAYDIRSVKRFFYAVIASVLILSFFVLVSSQVGAGRVVENMSFESVMEQFYVRFSPAMELIENFSFLELIFGRGAGTYFLIPWFEYRGLEVMHSNIDSAYLTYYVKYGLFGFALLYFYAQIFVVNSVYALLYRLFLGVIYFVEAANYQPFIIGFLATLVFSSFGDVRGRRNQ